MALRRGLSIASALFLLGIALLLIHPTLHLVPSVYGSNRTFWLVGYEPSGWNASQSSGANPTITVTQGDKVTIELSTGDIYTHKLVVDFDNETTNPADISDCSTTDACSGDITSSTFTPFTFTVSSTVNPGTYRYLCYYHYPYMVGMFVVQAAPPTPNFAISSNPSSLTFLQGSSGASTITLTSENGFSGTINLSATISPTGPTASLNPTSITISAGSTQTSALSVNSTSGTPSGSYTVTVTGTNGTLPHTATVSVTINAPASKDFSISSSQSSLNVASGSSGTTTITLTTVNGFTGTISLAGSVSPSGPSVSFSPASLTISGGSATSTLTVSAASMGLYSTQVSNGNYSVNITATSGSLSHSTTVQVTVGSSSSSPSGLMPLSSTVLIGVVVIIAAAVGVTVYLVRRKPK